MPTNEIPLGTQVVVDAGALGQLLAALHRRGYQIIGPTIRDSAVVYDSIESTEDLPAGWTAEHGAGLYRLLKRDDQALFGYVIGPGSWKQFLHPPEVALSSASREDGAFRILPGDAPPASPRAFLGVRACELAAIARQDRILLEDRYVDSIYRQRRENAFLIAVHCTDSAPTCFCASMETGPKAESGFDIALAEIVEPDRHVFLAEAGTARGGEVLAEVEHTRSNAETRAKVQRAVAQASSKQSRRIDTAGLREALYDAFDSPRWEKVAARCLACANCTMVCPTCFCITVEDSGDVSGHRADRRRKWDSCFSQTFSYIHGGSVRLSAKSRYRQWLTHKLAAWIVQFGAPGCVGCGRCITWCPVGIDITEETAALRGQEPPAAAQQGANHGDASAR
ncbi:MAG: 4Fe-4S dicluster domain-containing protein [Bryobacteraceae bacterium]